MQLFVIRHALAEDVAPDREDHARELSSEGRQRLKRVVKGLRALEVRFERVLTSPWTRASQTARRLSSLGAADPIETELLTRSPSAELLGLIAEHDETTAVVGHEPWLGELVAWLAFGDMRHGDALELKKASVIWLAGSAVPGGMTVQAMLPPRFLAKVR